MDRGPIWMEPSVCRVSEYRHRMRVKTRGATSFDSSNWHTARDLLRATSCLERRGLGFPRRLGGRQEAGRLFDRSHPDEGRTQRNLPGGVNKIGGAKECRGNRG